MNKTEPTKLSDYDTMIEKRMHDKSKVKNEIIYYLCNKMPLIKDLMSTSEDMSNILTLDVAHFHEASEEIYQALHAMRVEGETTNE